MLTGELLANRYRVEAKVGDGGMAVVFRARDEVLGRPVAIKVLRDQFAADQEFVERFFREAQAAASLSHPNVVNIYDVGRTGQTHFIVMEFVEGRNLKQILRERGALPVLAAAAIALQVAEALAHAHRHQLVHRDIKPHNVLITAEGRVKVTDFGIARATSTASLTRTGQVLGSVHYLAPEQARGQPAGAASDLYSLGVLLYEMLTGQVPFTGDTPLAVVIKHLEEQPVPPRELKPRIPAALERVVLRTLAKNPADRYPTLEAFIRDLQKAVPALERAAMAGVSAGPPGPADGTAGRGSSLPAEVAPLATNGARGAAAHGPPASGAAAAKAEPVSTAGQPLAGVPNGASDGRLAEEEDPAEPTIVIEDPKGERGVAGRVAAAGGRRRSRLVWLFLLAFFGGLLFAARGLEAILFPAEVRVPELIGLTEDQARAELAQLDLDMRVERRVYDARWEAQRVIAQDPEPDRSVRKGRRVFVTVSLGPEEGRVPDVVGQSRRQAELTLNEEGFVLGQVTEEFNPEVRPGYVIGQNPPGDTRLEKGRPVDLTVSKGVEVLPTLRLPDFRGSTLEEVRAELARLGLVLGDYWSVPAERVEPGVVIQQDPPPGTEVEQGWAINLILSEGPASLPGGPGQAGSLSAAGTPETADSTGTGPSGSASPGSGPQQPGPTPAGQAEGPSAPGAEWSREVQFLVPPGRDQVVAIVVRDEAGVREAYRATLPGGTEVVRTIRGRGEGQIRVFIGGTLQREVTVP